MEDREQLWKDYTGPKPLYLAHPWLHYNRYHEANLIVNQLKTWNQDISKLCVLDYGSGVGDYGFTLGREGAEICFYDKPEQIEFVAYRLRKEEKKFKVSLVEANDLWEFPPTIDMVIFGEVLEHLDNPLKVIKDFVNRKTKYIFTSSYPYRSDDPNDSYWHHRGHTEHKGICEMQKPCRELLENNYEYIKYEGQMRLWYRKGLL